MQVGASLVKSVIVLAVVWVVMTETHVSLIAPVLMPDDATPICAGMNVLGGNRIWAIGANTEYPELCMAIINYLCTPEGYLT